MIARAAQHPEVLPGRIRSKFVVNDETGCWIWIGAGGSGGYGRVNHPISTLAHRVVYTLLVGPIGEGLTIDHLCRVRECVNPAHMEPVTNAENTRRGESPPACNARVEHCIAGHPFDAKNTYRMPSGGRRCRRCHADRQLRYYHEQRSA